MPDLWYEVDTPLSPFVVPGVTRFVSRNTSNCVPWSLVGARCYTSAWPPVVIRQTAVNCTIVLRKVAKCWTQCHCLRAPALTVPGSVVVYPLVMSSSPDFTPRCGRCIVSTFSMPIPWRVPRFGHGCMSCR